MVKRRIALLMGATAIAVAFIFALVFWPIGKSPNLQQMEGNAKRGAYLARMSGCIACHTDGENGGAPLAGGVALATDFGTFYSPNLTQSAEHGMGAWTIGAFAKAVRQGVSPDGKPYYPAFPYPFYAKFTDQDIADLWAAFQTVPAVEQASIPHEMQFPFSFRAGMKLWRAAFVDFSRFEPDESQSELWNRGKYIVGGPAHCGACHTPRNLIGARKVDLRLQGADKLPNGSKSPAIDGATLIEKGWKHSALAYALKSGVKPDGDVFGGSMVEVVRDGTSFLTPKDLEAISVYLLGDNDVANQ